MAKAYYKPQNKNVIGTRFSKTMNELLHNSLVWHYLKKYCLAHLSTYLVSQNNYTMSIYLPQ